VSLDCFASLAMTPLLWENPRRLWRHPLWKGSKTGAKRGQVGRGELTPFTTVTPESPHDPSASQYRLHTCGRCLHRHPP
jgi:hypothetical protein